jgi:predicted lipid-binding transport protein (Tim44 family)
MSDTAEYVTLLVISIVVTVAVGRLLVLSGQPFLQEVFQNEKVTTSVNRLLSVLFHLITIGVLTIISVWSFDTGTQLQNMVVKFGIILIVLGIAYGISMLVLIRVRERRRADKISEEVQMRLSDRGVTTQPQTTQPQTAQQAAQQAAPQVAPPAPAPAPAPAAPTQAPTQATAPAPAPAARQAIQPVVPPNGL